MEFAKVNRYILRRMERGLPKNLFYHGIHHTIDVLKAAAKLADAEQISVKQKTMLLTAALFHDVGYLIRYKDNEIISADMCWAILPKFNYSLEEIMQITQMINSTTIPQKPQNRLDSILCDADLDYLGRDDFFITGCNLRREWKEYGCELNIKEWYEMQIDFLSKHHYFTRSAVLLREDKKQRHLNFLIRLLNKY